MIVADIEYNSTATAVGAMLVMSKMKDELPDPSSLTRRLVGWQHIRTHAVWIQMHCVVGFYKLEQTDVKAI